MLSFTVDSFAMVAVPVNVFPATKLPCAPLNDAPLFIVLFMYPFPRYVSL